MAAIWDHLKDFNLISVISRLGAQVVSGLGFIGGGTIFVVNHKKIKGLTTAAGLWACGVIGLAVGAGFYEGALNDVMRYFKDNRMMIGNLEITGKNDGDAADYSATLLVRSRAKIDLQKMTDRIRCIKGIVAVKEV